MQGLEIGRKRKRKIGTRPCLICSANLSSYNEGPFCMPCNRRPELVSFIRVSTQRSHVIPSQEEWHLAFTATIATAEVLNIQRIDMFTETNIPKLADARAMQAHLLTHAGMKKTVIRFFLSITAARLNNQISRAELRLSDPEFQKKYERAQKAL